MWFIVVVAELVVLLVGFLIGVFLSISINNFFLEDSKMDLKLPLYTARLNGAAIYSAPILFRNLDEAKEYIERAIKDANAEVTVADLKLVGYFNPFIGELEVCEDEETPVDEKE